MTVIGDLPRRNAHRHPDSIAFVVGDLRITWREFNDRVNCLASGLAALGLRKADRLVILSSPRLEVVEAYFAAAKLGLIIVPIHTGLVEREVGFMLSDVGARAILIEDAYCVTLGPMIEGVATIERKIVIGAAEGFSEFESIKNAGTPQELPETVSDDELFAIRFTSGTTGLPKGCPSTHRDWLRRSMNFIAHVQHTHLDRAMLLSPLSLGVGSSMLMSYSLVGAAMYLLPRFDASAAIQMIEAEKITTLMIPVPTLFARFLDAPEMADADLGSLRILGYGGAVFPLPLLRRTLERFQCDFFGVYGHLEAGGFSTYLMPEDHRLGGCEGDALEARIRRLGSCGREALQADVRVFNEADEPVAQGEVGELVVRTEGMISDYWNRPGEIGKSIRNGWFHTGDGAWIDTDGYVFISDRLKDVIRSGGMNISAMEVESIILNIDGVADVAIVGAPDKRWGEVVIACVVRKPGASVEAADIDTHCRYLLANYKTPKQIHFFDELPKNSMGKVLKRKLKDLVVNIGRKQA